MRKLLFIAAIFLFAANVKSQTGVYSISSGELIFGWADVESDGQNLANNMRFTAFLHLGQYVHFDFSNAIGIYSGVALRNIGFITEDDALDLEKEKHRSYTLGMPVALKLGSFRNNTYIYGGGEYELLFHYKYKYWEDGQKYKTSEWFSNRTNRFVPSLFAGIQLPKGLNLKFKYYLDDFLNTDFKKGDNPRNDYSRFGKTQMFHVSLCWQINTKDIRKVWDWEYESETMARIK